jgi:hypothetical protein
MKKVILTLALVAFAGFAVAQDGLKPLSYPGSNWSNLTYNSNPIRNDGERVNTTLQGNIEQGIVWAQFSNGWRLNTYAAMGYSVDNLGLPWDNKVTPTLGVKFQRPWSNGIWDIGAQVVHQHNFRNIPPGQPSSGTGAQLYVQYWTGWDLKK